MAEQFFTITYNDFDGETSHARFRGAALTAANFDAQATLRGNLDTAVAAITLGNKARTQFGEVAITGAGEATSSSAHRESKWWVQYHDNTTFKTYRMEIPCPDPNALDTNDRKHAEIGDAGVVDAFVTAFEAYVLSPVGNAVTVDEITWVGRNL